MKRKIIEIDEKLCNGCGNCIPGCPEGALQLIYGKAVLVADYYCDGLGACIGDCPQGAITTTEKEAEPYNERKTIYNIISKGENVIKAHLKHLYNHGEQAFLEEAIDELSKNNIPIPDYKKNSASLIKNNITINSQFTEQIRLQNWPVQLKLINPQAPYFKNAELVFAADCTGFAYPEIQQNFIKNKICIILCPKLDPYTEEYIEKIKTILVTNNIKFITVIRMQVPCCGGLTMTIKKALYRSNLKMGITEVIISTNGDILK